MSALPSWRRAEAPQGARDTEPRRCGSNLESFRHLVVRQFVHDAEFESVALVLRQLIERGSKRGAWREPFFDGGISVLGSEVERESETQARTRLDAVVADRLAENVPGNSEQPRKS